MGCQLPAQYRSGTPAVAHGNFRCDVATPRPIKAGRGSRGRCTHTRYATACGLELLIGAGLAALRLADARSHALLNEAILLAREFDDARRESEATFWFSGTLNPQRADDIEPLIEWTLALAKTAGDRDPAMSHFELDFSFRVRPETLQSDIDGCFGIYLQAHVYINE